MEREKPRYDVRMDTTQSGQHAITFMLGGAPIKGCPVAFHVKDATADPAQCFLTAPPHDEKVYASVGEYEHAIVTLSTHDRFRNPCTRGGMPVIGRIQLVKQIKRDPNESSTLLMPNNHSVVVDDLGNGTYHVKVALKITAVVKVFVQIDKNLGAAGELPPVTLSFHPRETPHDEQ